MRSAIVILLVVDVVIAVVACPLMLGWIKSNSWFGLRTSRTLGDAEIWKRANRIAGRVLIAVAATHAAYCTLQLVSILGVSPSWSAASLTAGVAIAGFYAKRHSETLEAGD